MLTLPSIFKSLVGKTVKIEMKEPQYVIELLGDLLGVTDYKSNKAAFWFLDTIALQVLYYKDDLDDYHKSVLISWLAGEMKLIRDEKLCREDFFKKMKILFLYVAEKLYDSNRFLHWELFIDECYKIISKYSTINESATSETKYLFINKPSKELMVKDGEHMFRESKPCFVKENSNHHNYESRQTDVTIKSLEKSLKNLKISPTTENMQTNVLRNIHMLDIIIEATYSMYANEMRYALIYAVFVMPMHMQTYYMPHTLRIPRQIKFADSEGGTFDTQLYEQLEKSATETTLTNRTHKKHKEKTNMRKGQMNKELNIEIPPTPPPSLIEEEILAENRRFILPLIKSQKATQIFEIHAENEK